MEDRVVYVGFSKHRHVWAVMSFLIRWWEQPAKLKDPKTWFKLYFASHSFIIFPQTKRRKFFLVSEAAGSSVRYMSEKNFLGHAEILKVYKLTVSQSVYDDMKTYSEQYAGNPYALLENAGIVLARIFRRKKNYWSGDGAQKCSELVLRNAILRLPGMTMDSIRNMVFQDWGIQLSEDIDLIGVKDCHDIMMSLELRGLAKEDQSFVGLKLPELTDKLEVASPPR